MPISDRYIAISRLSGALRFAASALLAAVLTACLPTAPHAAAENSPILTPEEVAGVSMN